MKVFRRRRDLLLVPTDALSAVLVAWVAYRLRFEGQVVAPEYVGLYQLAAGVLAVAWPLAGRYAGLYSRSALRPGGGDAESALTAALVVGALGLLVNFLLPDIRLSRGWIGLVVLGLALSGVASRRLLQRLRRGVVPLGIGLERYVLVGDDESAQRLLSDLTRAAGAPFELVQVLPTDASAEEVARCARATRCDGIILPAGVPRARAARLASTLSGTGTDVLVAPAIGDLEMRVASIAMLHGVPLLRVAGLAPRRRAVRHRPHDRARRGIAVLGTRGIPANYGGFETFAERLALHLVEDGVRTVVYCRTHYSEQPGPWRGVERVVLPTVRSKYLDTVVHTFLSAMHLVVTRGPKDVVLCNAANAPVVPLLRLFGRRVVLNVDGLEWRRGKWGVLGRSWYRLGEWLSVRWASVLVTDAEEVRTYYRVRHDTDSVMIPYGADVLERDSLPLPAELAVEPDGYALYVSRWERENNPLLVVDAHSASGVELDLVLLGAATYDTLLADEVRAAAGSRTRLPGPLYGDSYRALQSSARCYIHATEVGGTHPALIEALGAGNVCLVLDTPENREVAGDAASYFRTRDDLATLLAEIASLPPRELAGRRARARARAEERFSWRAVGDAYLDLVTAD